MNITLSAPLGVCPPHQVMVPASDNISADDRLFVVCDNRELVAALIQRVNEVYDPDTPFSPDDFNRALHRALDDQRHNITKCSMALMIMHSAGILVAQMGKSRILHVKRGARVPDYDSRDQVRDIYSGRAKVQQLVNLDADDHLLLTLAAHTDADALTRTMASLQLNEQARLDAVMTMLRNNEEQTPATMIVRVDGVEGRGSRWVRDLNWRWVLFYLLLVAAIVAVAVLSFNTRLVWDSDTPSEPTPIDTVASPPAMLPDTMSPPPPAVEPVPDLQAKETTPVEKEVDAPKPVEQPQSSETTEPEPLQEAPVPEPVAPVDTSSVRP